MIFAGVIAYYNGASFASWTFSLPWWSWSAFWIVVIVGLVIYKIVMVAQESGSHATAPRTQTATATPQAAPAKQRTFNAATAPAPAKKTFNASFGSRAGGPSAVREGWSLSSLPGMAALAEAGPIVWWIIGGVIGLLPISWFIYWYVTTEWIDKEGYPIPKPWWVWPLAFLLLGLGVLTFKIVQMVREGAADGAFRSTSRPVAKPQKPQKPTGFNVQGKKR